MIYKRAIFALIIFGLITACSSETLPIPQPDEPILVGMTLEEWQEAIDLKTIDEVFMLLAQQMPGFAGYFIRDDFFVVMRRPVPEGGIPLPENSDYPDLEGTVPITDRSNSNIEQVLKTLINPDIMNANGKNLLLAFEEATYEARQMVPWKRLASSLMFSDQIDAVSVDFKESTNKIVVGTSTTTDEASATIRRTLVDAGIPSEALVIRQGVIITPLPEPL